MAVLEIQNAPLWGSNPYSRNRRSGDGVGYLQRLEAVFGLTACKLLGVMVTCLSISPKEVRNVVTVVSDWLSVSSRFQGAAFPFAKRPHDRKLWRQGGPGVPPISGAQGHLPVPD